MNYKSILFYLGIYSLLVSIFSILNILYSIYFNFNLDLDSYIFTFLISAITGVLFFYLGFKDYKKISLNEQLVTIILTFLFIPFLISIPYYLSIYDINFLNAYFESVSGFTTTGFSIIESVKTLDEPLLLWRASSQWLGGLLFLIFTIGTIGSKQIKIKPAYLISGGTSGRNFYNNFNYNFIKILLIYFLLTIIIIFSYKLLDMRLLDAFALSFTTVSSGGFLPVDNLSTIIETNFQTFVLSITLLIPIFNFYLLHDIFTKEFSLKNNLEDLHLLMLIILITFFFYFFVIPDEGFLNVLFAIVSSISTSGISTYSSNFDLSLFFILLTIIGGSLVSTSSGFKYTRFYILLKISYQEIYRLVKPINIIDKKLFNVESKIDDQDVKIAFLVFIFFIASIFILASLLTFENLNFEDSFKLSILTLTNTVNSTLYGTENLDFFNFNLFTKVSLILFMVLAKVEIIAVIYLIRKVIFKE